MSETIEAIEKYGLSKKNQPKSLFSKVGLVGGGSVGQTISRIISASGIEVHFVELSEERAADIPVWAVMYLEQLHDDALERYGDEDWSGASRRWAHAVLIIEWLTR